MAGKIHLEIVTPEGVKFSEEVDELTAPSVDGQFGVLPAHRPLLAGLKTGVLTYVINGQESAVAVGPGFVKIADDQARVITDRFMLKADVDPIVARKDLQEATDEIAVVSAEATMPERLALVARSRWAATRLELYGDPPPATVVMQHEMRLLTHEDYTSEQANLNEADESPPEESAS